MSGSPPRKHMAVVPVVACDYQTRRALCFAGTLAPHVLALHVRASEDQQTGDFEKAWERLESHVPLVVLDAPYWDVQRRLVRALEMLRRTEGTDLITVVIPQRVASANRRDWVAPFWSVALRTLPGIVVTDAPAEAVAGD